jgi:preprotein translocase subunit SecY
MSSAAEQLAANFNFNVFSKAHELKKRIWYTLGALIIYRLGSYIPLPGVDIAVIKTLASKNANNFFGIFNMFSGGALERMSILALNIVPYISASIIIQLMTAISPTLEALKKEGESGRQKINQYTRYLTVFLATAQAFGLSTGLVAQGAVSIDPIIFKITTVINIVGGTLFLMWLGEQITSRGIGNGVSLIIFSGIVANLPQAALGLIELGQDNTIPIMFILFLFAAIIAIFAFIVFVERAIRKVLVQYPKRQVGARVQGGEASYIPLKLNSSGVLPPIFAQALLVLPSTAVMFVSDSSPEWLQTLLFYLSPGKPLVIVLMSILIVFFAYFYTTIIFNPADTAENLKKSGGFIPGIRPGQATADFIERLLNRLTFFGASYLVIVCLMPELLKAKYAVPFYFGGTSLLIIVSVTLDTVAQVQSHLVAHQYEGLLKKANLKGRRR